MSLRDTVNLLRERLAGLPKSFPTLASDYDVPLSALYRFSRGDSVKLDTLFQIDELVAKENASNGPPAPKA